MYQMQSRSHNIISLLESEKHLPRLKSELFLISEKHKKMFLFVLSNFPFSCLNWKRPEKMFPSKFKKRVLSLWWRIKGNFNFHSMGAESSSHWAGEITFSLDWRLKISRKLFWYLHRKRKNTENSSSKANEAERIDYWKCCFAFGEWTIIWLEALRWDSYKTLFMSNSQSFLRPTSMAFLLTSRNFSICWTEISTRVKNKLATFFELHVQNVVERHEPGTWCHD